MSAVTGNDDADGGDGDAGDQPGQASRGRCGEEEFVVLAAVEGLFEGGTGSDGDGLGVDFRRDAGLAAETGEVEGEPVREVHCGGCEA